jgi:hypothetical protein
VTHDTYIRVQYRPHPFNIRPAWLVGRKYFVRFPNGKEKVMFRALGDIHSVRFDVRAQKSHAFIIEIDIAEKLRREITTNNITAIGLIFIFGVH